MKIVHRSVYIGIGGAGIRAISHTKKMYNEAFGEGNIPPVIAFLGMDCDLHEFHQPAAEILSPHEIVPLPTQSARMAFEVGHQQGKFDWMFPENISYIPDSFYEGTRQVRTNGRLVTELNIEHVRSRISMALNQVLSVNSVIPVHVNVHIAMSLVGGMGSGAFIHVAQLVKAVSGSHATVFGYGVLHGVFRANDKIGVKTPKVAANAYSAVLDLDYFQSATTEKPVSFTIAGETKTVTLPLYDNFFLIDNRTENNDVVENIDALCQALGSILYFYGSEEASFLSHTGWKSGCFNFRNKSGWVQRLGICQVVYKGDLLAELYGMIAKQEILRQFKNTSDDLEKILTDWATVSGVRMDGDEHERLIHRIFDPAELKDVVLDPKASSWENFAALKRYLEDYQSFPSREDIRHIGESILSTINQKLVLLLNGPGGTANAEAVLTSLVDVCAVYKEMMEGERKRFVGFKMEQEERLDKVLSEYHKYLSRPRIFQSKKQRQELIDALSLEAKAVLKSKVEIRRRDEAIGLLHILESELNGILARVKELIAKLDSLDETIEKFSKLRKNCSKRPFECDLSFLEPLDLGSGICEVVLPDFTASLSKSIIEMTKEELDEAFDAYVQNLPRCHEYRTRRVEDVIQNLSDSEYARLKCVVERMTSPLLKLDGRGLPYLHTVGNISMGYMVHIYKDDSGKKTRMEMDQNLVLGGFGLNFISSDTPDMRQRVAFFRADAAVRPYCVSALDEKVQFEYEHFIDPVSHQPNPHFDRHVFDDMKKSGFKLKPDDMTP